MTQNKQNNSVEQKVNLRIHSILIKNASKHRHKRQKENILAIPFITNKNYSLSHSMPCDKKKQQAIIVIERD